MSAALGAEERDLREVEAIVRAAGTSFYRGMRILPPDRRAAMYAIYAFCRLVDDIADEPAPIQDKRRALGAWRTRIEGLAQNRADGAVERVLLLASRQYALRPEDFLAVIDGMQMDAETVIVAPDFATFDLYCDRVASAVGRLSVRAFGDGSPSADVVAHHLGRALQMTNILRDLHEDAARGRLYLPREWLVEAGVAPHPQTALPDPRLGEVCARAARDARMHFDQAARAMTRCDRRAMRPARLMGATYAAVLARLEQRGWTRLAEPAPVPRHAKLWLAVKFGLGLA